VAGLDKYWETLAGLLWPRLAAIMQLNIQSVRKCSAVPVPVRDWKKEKSNQIKCSVQCAV
jgi:hypothetical protein